jgi:8-oxo-dGTP pyrophosphatase MutT (NUDIX family)
MPRHSHLRSLLEALTPADARELEHKTRIVRLLADSQAPFSREQFVPGHVTASAFIVNEARDALLLILHAKLGRWLQPGGHIEADDVDVAHAAEREVREEVGLERLTPNGVLDVDVHSIPAHRSQPAHEHFDVRFLFTTVKDARVVAGSDAQAARWVPIAELLRPACSAPAATHLPHDDSVLRAVRKLTTQRL